VVLGSSANIKSETKTLRFYKTLKNKREIFIPEPLQQLFMALPKRFDAAKHIVIIE